MKPDRLGWGRPEDPRERPIELRRASTPLPASHRERLNPRSRRTELCHPQLGQSLSCEPRGRLPSPAGAGDRNPPARRNHVDPLNQVAACGMTRGGQEQPDDTFERTLSVDGEETTLVVIDTWEAEKRSLEEDHWLHNHCMQVGDAYVIVYSITDRGSFESASELRIQLRRTRQAENLPIILVGNKTDLVRSREVSVEGGSGKGLSPGQIF
ncbi:hypothetical protein E2320_009452 [Naja naja]|nr:hypothetical protein E2320_009452 [Naja naja]